VSASIFFSSSSTFPYELFFFSVCVCMENRWQRIRKNTN
jgi:hypothetical protein